MLSGTEILTTAQMRAIESAAMASGKVTGLKLMERAGAAVAGHIRLRWPRPGRATVLCGPGNNGGDGYVIARHLARAGWQVRVLGIDNTPGPDAAEMRRQWLALGPILPLTDAELRSGPDCDVYVDAIFGTGLTRPPGREIAAILSCLGGYGGDAAFYRPRLVAVDCPSGLCLDSGAFLGQARQPVWHNLRAALTVAFDSPKPGHLLERGPECCGELVIADIGLREWRETEAGPSRNGAPWRTQRMASLSAIWPGFEIADRRRFADEKRKRAAWLTKREGDARHKFGHGHALILAGGMGQGGAARLSARAALRVGAGLVTICPPQSALIEHLGPPDALTALAAQGFSGLHRNCVLTPHAGEFARLFPDLAERLDALPDKGPAYSRVDAVRDAAVRSGAVVLLKGPDTVIAEPPPRAHPHLTGRAVIHSASDVPWLATAGSGDVLAGLIAGLLARGLPALDAAAMGAWLHAAAARRFGPGLIADDLPDQIPGVFRDLGG